MRPPTGRDPGAAQAHQHVLTGFLTTASILIFILAGVGVFVATDKLDEVRQAQETQDADRLNTIQQCAQALAAKKTHPEITLTLPLVCTALPE
ncbi:hypothetical protein [Mycolicibacterium diernhoferi]|uniref:Uncharacterized protein n=1 Tax=Mycolicibacterium diernhoferi TaxID=1801 RepID=A0A1Q4HLR7_9MYCO|nr:hypothetical protein [Mycolicibacterium diernhoferi]OJZ68456.1 hypothetical protein BRW64_02455 [Mycolicibacterium diernhoferi]OPE55553.1 hypothetical protein BV510_04495 [Mycolicibacterium diernhoferi]PEG52087.1 hypothetical protein CRI78_23395 [Mycolicibacterium diernhoferi]QYL21045.1 hypothetical protein K0O62_18590 [Mycolicibacterium diernhoferi]